MYLFGEPAAELPEINSILETAFSRKEAIRNYPLDKILSLMDRLAQSWSDPGYKYYQEALEKLPAQIGFSPEMVKHGVGAMCHLLRAEGIRARMRCDLQDEYFLDHWRYYDPFEGFYYALPRGVVLHVSAGNVFVGAVDTLVQGIVTKNVNIMKLSSADPFFPVLFARSLKEHDEDGVVSASMALLLWKGGDQAVEAPLKAKADCIVVYGGKETIESYRGGAGLHTKIVEYGPKYSLMLIEDETLRGGSITEAARLMARDVSMWEQSACSSPHVIYLEDHADSGDTAAMFVPELCKALEYWAEQIPQSPLSPDQQVEILKTRELAHAAEALGQGRVYYSAGKSCWTVVLESVPDFRVSPQHRTVFVKPVPRLEDAVTALVPMGQFIQSVAIYASFERTKTLGRAMTGIGADRIVEIGNMARRKHGTPHDGTRGLAELVRWTSIGKKVAREDEFDYAPDEIRRSITESRLIELFQYVRANSPYFKNKYEGIDLRSLEELQNLPVLSQQELAHNSPPAGEGFLTGPTDGTWVFGSGGSTGAPKVIYRTIAEQHYNAARLGKGLRLAVFRPTDRVANLLFAGNLWASFISSSMALESVGCQILPIAGNISVEQIVKYLRALKATGAISIPSVMLSIAEYVEANKIDDVKLERIAVGGEHLYGEARRYLQKILGAEIVASAGYATNDTGAVAFQCQHTKENLHHIHEDLHYVEIVDPETFKVLPDGEEGLVLLTNLNRRLMPILRYNIGDMGRMVPGQCACGRKAKLFELLGRSDQALIIGGGNVYPDLVAGIIGSTPELSHHLQMRAKLHDHKDLLEVLFEHKEGISSCDTAALAKRLEQALFEQSRELATMRDRGLIAGVKVSVLAPGKIERNSRTGKIKPTVDER